MSMALSPGSKASRLVYEEHGEPADVLKLVEDVLPAPGAAEVLVQVLAVSS
jgi:NADPH:quinone reductase-like Zn-dependent oxidoreductase